MKKKVICPYCGQPTKQVTGEVIYAHIPKLHKRKYWLCEPCWAYVGCHPGSGKAMGTPAKAAVRKLRTLAHYKFDTLWQVKGMTRNGAYIWLRGQLGLTVDECHISMFDGPQCMQVINLMNEVNGVNS